LFFCLSLLENVRISIIGADKWVCDVESFNLNVCYLCRMCKALMPGDEESMSDEAIWETLPVRLYTCNSFDFHVLIFFYIILMEDITRLQLLLESIQNFVMLGMLLSSRSWLAIFSYWNVQCRNCWSLITLSVFHSVCCSTFGLPSLWCSSLLLQSSHS